MLSSSLSLSLPAASRAKLYANRRQTTRPTNT